jgi:imidazolonepropionase-like amidohydrolase
MWRSRGLCSCLLVCSLAFLSFVLSAQQAQPPRKLLVIDRVTYFDGLGGPMIKDGAIVIEGGRIVDIGRRGTIKPGPGVTILDARGKFAMPGLIDAHVHFDQSSGIFARPDAVDLRDVRSYNDEIAWTKQRLPQTLLRYLRSGITSVVDMGGPMWTLDFRDATNQTALAPAAPLVAVAGPLISTEADPPLESSDSPVILIETPDEALRLVRRIAERKPDLIKILFIHHPSQDLDRQADLVKIAIAESHKLGIRVAAHATQLDTAKAVLAAGADILVHSIEDRRVDAEFLSMLKTRGILYIPTLMVTEGYDEVFGRSVKLTAIEKRVGDPEVIQSWAELEKIPASRIPGGVPAATMSKSRPLMFLNLQILNAADVRIAAGSDAGNIGTLHGPALHREMELMEQAGMRPFDILMAATRNAADVMGKGNEVGTLQKQKVADILLLDEDPTRDIRNTQKIFKVLKRGEFVEIQ